MRRDRVRRASRARRVRGGSAAAPQVDPVTDYARVLACLRRSRQPLTVPGLVRLLGLDSSAEAGLRRQLEFLEARGVVFSQRRGRWTMHARARIVIGRLSSPRRGYGFVIPEDGAGKDLYVPGRRLQGARHGDLVLARLVGSPRGRRQGGSQPAEGEILAVLERRPPYLAGLFHRSGRGDVVVPRDERVCGELVIDRPLAGTARRSLEDGTVVWAEVTAPEDRFRPARGRILAILGLPDDPEVAGAVIRRECDLPGDFPPEAMAEARSWGSGSAPPDRAGREDFTGTTVLTVDPATARDHDDAVGLQRLETPRGPVQRLAVHIADVARYVPEGGAVDAEATRRGTSVYFPGSNIPMLPEALSAGLCSLLPGVERLTQSVIIDFDGQGRRVGYRFADGVISSAARMTYEEVAAILRGEAADQTAPVAGMVREMEGLSRALRARRMRRGSLDLNLPETEVVVDARGRPVELRVVVQDASHRIIEEFMLAANEVVAGYLNERMSPSLYRVHEDPDPSGIDEVEEELLEMGFPVRRERGPASARIRGLLEPFRGRPEEPAVAMMILRSLKLARYSHEAIGHFGLAAPLYTHFTSPIRRYPDLVVHRILRETRSAGPRPPTEGPDPAERLAAVAHECSRLERRAEEAERAMVDWLQALYMKERVGQEFHGMVTGMTAGGVFVTLEGLGVEGLVPPGAARGWDGREEMRAGRWRLGDRLRVRVQAVDTFRARVALKPLSTG